MIFRVKQSGDTSVRNPYGIPHFLFTFFVILAISPVTGCIPPAGTPPTIVFDTERLTATAVNLASPTPTTPAVPSATSVAPVISANTQASAHAPLTFTAEADAWVAETEPDDNNGTGENLRSDGSGDAQIETYIRFTVTGISGTVQSAQLRVYAANNRSENGPAVYMTDPAWEETDITWNQRPDRTSNALDNKDQIAVESWVEYSVTSRVTGDGTYSFGLIADSDDGIVFSSREGSFPPELVITLGEAASVMPTATLPPGAEILVGAGDIASCDDEKDELTAQLLDEIPGTIFTTGDNAYSDGTYEEYVTCYDPTWGRHKDRTRPIPGSHEYHTPGAAGYFQYFDNIEPYYAYDLGAWRIYALNSELDMSEGSPLITWLEEDLAENARQCVLAYWHRPRWSSGEEHGRDPTVQPLWEILYEAGAELVLNGHEHNYERFMPMNAEGEPDPNGLRQIVVGTGGGGLYEFDEVLPTSEVRDASTFGVLKLILRETGYDWQFIPIAGSTFTDSGSTECH